MNKVTIILTSFNRPQGVIKSIESVLSQTYKDFTLYVMDDNSVLEVQRILKEYEKKDNRIRLFISNVKEEDRLKRCRYAVLINQALRESNEQYITYLTDDCIYLPNRLERMITFLDGHHEAATVYGTQKVINGQGKTIMLRDTNEVLKVASYIVDHNSIMHRREVLEKVGYWEESAMAWRVSDALFWDKLTKAGYLFYPLESQEITEVNMLHKKSISECIMGNRDFTKGLRE